jgi:DNA (cytosine-5)-methyltransferase 1
MNSQKTVTEDFGTTHCSVAAPLTFGSLFAGIGGIDLGFERAGLQCKWQVEIEPYAQKILAKHWPNVRRHDDVRTWPQPDTEYVDIIAGGFPCQDISYAGKGAGLQGERSGLFFEVCRIVSDMGPRIVVLENVAALLTRGMDEVLGSLASIGYDAEWHCIPAAAVGAPHIRDRVFILAYANESRESERRLQRGGEQLWISRDHGQDQERFSSDAKGDGWKERLPNGSRSGEGIEAREKHRFGNCGGWWEIEPAVDRVADGIPSRLDRLRGLGNAVVPQVAEYIGRCIVAASENVA